MKKESAVHLIYLSISPSISQSVSICLSIFNLSVYLSICLSICLSVSIYLSICLSVYLSINLHFSVYHGINLSISACIYPLIYLTTADVPFTRALNRGVILQLLINWCTDFPESLIFAPHIGFPGRQMDCTLEPYWIFSKINERKEKHKER